MAFRKRKYLYMQSDGAYAGAAAVALDQSFASYEDEIIDRGYNVKWFGAKTDGTDCIAAIQNALDTISAAGGGILWIPVGTFTVAPTQTNYIHARSNVTIKGTGPKSILQVQANVGDYKLIIGRPFGSVDAEVTNFAVCNLCIDQNSAANTTANLNLADLSTYQFGIWLTGNYNDIRIHDNTFLNACGVNTVVFSAGAANVQGQNIRVERNNINFVRARSVASPFYDNSAIYADCLGQIISNNRITGKVSDRPYGAIETHNGNSTVTGNVVDGYSTLVNVVTASQATDARANNNITVSGNTLANGNYGIRLWSIGGFTLRNVVVSNNTIELDPVTWNENQCSGIVLADGSTTGDFDTLSITSNTITFAPMTATSLDFNGFTLGQTGMQGIGLGASGNCNNVIVANNIIKNAPAKGIHVGKAGFTYSNIRISGNVSIDAGLDHPVGLTSGYCAHLFFIGDSIVNCTVFANTFIDTGVSVANGVQWYFLTPTAAINVELRNNKYYSNQPLTRSIDGQVSDFDLNDPYPKLAVANTFTANQQINSDQPSVFRNASTNVSTGGLVLRAAPGNTTGHVPLYFQDGDGASILRIDPQTQLTTNAYVWSQFGNDTAGNKYAYRITVKNAGGADQDVIVCGRGASAGNIAFGKFVLSPTHPVEFYDPTTGNLIATLDLANGLTLAAGKFNGDGSGLSNLSGIGVGQYIANNWLAPNFTPSTAAIANGTMNASAVYLAKAMTLKGIGAEITAAGAIGSLLRLGIYFDNGFGLPSTLLLDAGTIDGTSATAQSIVIAQAVGPGRYWLVGVPQGAPASNPTLRINSGPGGAAQQLGSPSLALTTNSGSQTGWSYNGAAVTGALPGSWSGASSITNSTRVAVQMQ